MVDDSDIEMDCESTEELSNEEEILVDTNLSNKNISPNSSPSCVKFSRTKSSPCGSKRVFPKKNNPVPKRFRHNSDVTFVETRKFKGRSKSTKRATFTRSVSVHSSLHNDFPLPNIPPSKENEENQKTQNLFTSNDSNTLNSGFTGTNNEFTKPFAFSCVKRTKSEIGNNIKRRMDLRHSTNSINIPPQFKTELVESCKMISTTTCANLINGKFTDLFDKYYIIDCRYPYEFNGGHIKSAINIPPSERSNKLDELFFNNPSSAGHRLAIIIHCEFSSVRGPATYSALRSIDRSMNLRKYPNVFYPHVYVMKGGYRKFFQEFGGTSNCNGSYTEMKDKKFKKELKYFESLKTKKKIRSQSFISLPPPSSTSSLSRSTGSFNTNCKTCNNSIFTCLCY